MRRLAAALALALLLTGAARDQDSAPIPIVARDSLIRAGETHFAHLRQITFGGENAEAYWSPDGKSLTMQSTRNGYGCDQIFLQRLEKERSLPRLVSTGRGVTTCSYFLTPSRILFSSTHLGSPDCPQPPDRSRGYAWAVNPDFDIFVRDLKTDALTRLTDTPGYDAEATLSTDGKHIVFTSTRDGDLELYTMDPNGRNVVRLTHELGYDGGAFFSPDGRWICYRTDHPTDSTEVADYQALLADHLVRPSNFDLYLVNLDGSGLEKVTAEESFDGFPMFSPDGRRLAFSSNRGQARPGETNVFIADWK